MNQIHKSTKCCLCDSEAVVIYYMSHGCVVLPDVTIQPLCSQHESKMTPIGYAELIKDLRIYES